MTRIAEAKVISGTTPRFSGPMATDAVSSGPSEIRWLSAEKVSSNPFWSAMDSPKVTRSGGMMSSPSVRFSTTFWSTQPVADRAALVEDLVRPVPEDPRDRPHERRLARADRADDRDGLAPVEPEVHAEERLEGALEGGEPTGFEKRRHALIPR